MFVFAKLKKNCNGSDTVAEKNKKLMKQIMSIFD